ncbi:xanthine dehydrogenase family protein molybdopterin-binding subunit [Duganella dendranthematis]|uniref:Xanthine dehydrogenase family protein molybdopterin-binding subunit n=1 Tax=Duganella dendranthematis TaxID=2728021 RepID=A0ABX6MAP4_9BURK|nr:xanthine dehydrogenase family protein molybdopterin-binding subunit [Duganella dendranthematis]QJD91404.1 xanthine dehydrogenase family protein molybdopterin-binding subunit [Duganella dendranthematis]
MTTNRREFLKTTAVVGGGLTLGVFLPAQLDQAVAAGTLHTPNAWVHIADDNTITLLSARSEMGQGVYTSMPMLIAEELGVDIRKIKVEIAPVAPVYTNALLGAQITGGSTSVRDGWDKLRIAGAQVRTMLVNAAAARWNVDAAQLRAADGKVTGPGGRSATYGELAEAASKLPVPKKVTLKEAKNFKVIGKPTKRLDTAYKVNGTAEYGIDVKLPGMVYASLEQCPVIGGKPTSFDAAKAKAMPGVTAVVQIRDGVAVVADTWWHAKKAREALAVQWDEGAVARIDNASMQDGIRNAKDATIPIKKTGDAKAALNSASKKLSAEYWSPLLAHATMEPQNFTASYKDGKCLVIGPAQFQQGTQGNVATAIGLKPEDVTVKTTFLGGGFGRRLEYDFAVQAAEISKAVGKPVKLLWTREDDTTHDFYRPMALHRMAGGLDANGKPVALTLQLTSQSISQRAFGLPKGTLDPFMAEAAVVGYDIPNMTQELIEHDSGLRVGYWRSVSHALNAFANESFIDEMAAAAGKDPYQFRLALLDKQPRFAKVLKLAADKSGWGKPLPKGHYRGIALMEGYDTYMAQVAEISVDKDHAIKVHHVWVAADLGQMINPDTVEAQLQSSIAFGLSSALGAEITLDKGRVQQTNFHDYPVLRMNEMPKIDVTLVPSTEKPGGIGEPATALIVPAVANALFAATGKRVRQLPLSAQHIQSA